MAEISWLAAIMQPKQQRGMYQYYYREVIEEGYQNRTYFKLWPPGVLMEIYLNNGTVAIIIASNGRLIAQNFTLRGGVSLYFRRVYFRRYR